MGRKKGIHESEIKLIIEFRNKSIEFLSCTLSFCNRSKSHNLELGPGPTNG